jgi:hypothetical protein
VPRSCRSRPSGCSNWRRSSPPAAWISRDQLTALLWPELPPDAARRNLRKLIFRAQRQPWFGAEVRADALRWEVSSDLSDFDAAIAAARRFASASLRIADEHGLSVARTFALVNLALIEIEDRNFDAARTYLAQARAADDATGEGMVSVDIRLAHGRLLVRTGQPDAALPFLREGLAMARARLDEPNQLAAIAAVAEYHAQRGERVMAAAYWMLVAGQPAVESGELQDARRGLGALDLAPDETAQAEQAARELTLDALCRRLLEDA